MPSKSSLIPEGVHRGHNPSDTRQTASRVRWVREARPRLPNTEVMVAYQGSAMGLESNSGRTREADQQDLVTYRLQDRRGERAKEGGKV